MKKENPFICSETPNAVVKNFVTQKKDLKERGYPLEETKDLVLQLLSPLKKKLEGLSLSHKDLIISVPSGSGTNKVTEIMAALLSKHYGVTTFVEPLVQKLHRFESKLNLNPEDRMADPIRFHIHPKTKDIADHYERVFIVDDLLSQGDNTIKLKKTLEKVGIRVNGIIPLVTVSRYLPNERDFVRVANKIITHLELPITTLPALEKAVSDVFGDYTRRRLGRFEIPIHTKEGAEKALNALSSLLTLETGKILKIETKQIKSKGISI